MRLRRAALYPVLIAVLFGTGVGIGTAENIRRTPPKPLPQHPGNIFLGGEEIVVRLPGESATWNVLDYDGQAIAEVAAKEGKAALGRLPVGFYRLKRAGETHWISVGVVAPLPAPTPLTSPIAMDVAMAWFYPAEKMEVAANLCALAGVNWVRDRLNWAEMEPRRGEFARTNRYDASAYAQSRARLQALQVNHISPAWANPKQKRFPLDLRDAYRFYREMAARWKGQVRAFEPWNEADIPMFGGHTGGEMAAMQKAAYLGLKAGHSNVIACLNVFALHNQLQLADLHDNETWPYFDTFNLHHYAPFDQYPKLYADFRAVSGGRPLWVTECSLPVKWTGDDQLKEPTEADLRVQAERVAKTFASSLHEGASATFYFLLPHYSEGQTQFGIVRPDLTPRPAFVALAAVGRLLANAKPLGQCTSIHATVHAYLFRAEPDGHAREVLVAWTTSGEATLELPTAPQSVVDHLGRERKGSTPLSLTSAPVFALLPEGTAKKMLLNPPPKPAPCLEGEASPVVLQALWPEEKVSLRKSAYRISSEKAEAIPVYLYSFHSDAVRGRLRVTGPSGWKIAFPEQVELAPQERKELALTVDCRETTAQLVEKVRIEGDFGPAGRPILSVRVMPEPIKVSDQNSVAIPAANEAKRWQPNIAGNGRLVLTNTEAGLVIEAEPLGADRWVYPTISLGTGERPPSGSVALSFGFTLLEGNGQFRAVFDEQNGSSHAVEFSVQPGAGQTIQAVAFLEEAVFGQGWSKPDANEHLDVEQITSVRIGCSGASEKVAFRVKDVRWVLK
ncbi:MAG: hypothetical protein HY674_01275 [Chloroflexi bacterium]|nr:hypothetical protein [Chloroflexota bacterium]